MKKGIIWLIVIIVIVIIGGLMFSRSTSPVEEDLTPDLDESEVKTGGGAGQFIQEVPAVDGPADVEEKVVVPESDDAADTATDEDAATGETVTVTVTMAMDESGFTPKSATVAAGDTVTFVNNGQALHWPASAVHPVHTVLPGFDALKGLPTGGTYSFTFSRVGTWNCHDHLNPRNTCAITVK